MGEKATKVRPKFGNKPCSEDFVIAFLREGGMGADCEFCGRYHFDSTMREGEYEPGEFDEVMAKHNSDPDKYILSEGTVHYGLFMGKQVVYGCPCGFDGYFEDVIWELRFFIGEYFSARSEEILKEAADTAQLTKDLRRAIGCLSQ